MSADELRAQRDAEHLARRIRRGWEQALGGRSSLAAPMRRGRVRGGTQPPPVGAAVAQLGEFAYWHMRGALVVDESDDHPLVYGGRPYVICQLKIAPTSDVEIDVMRNGSPIESPIVLGSGVSQLVTQFDTWYDPLDTYTTAVTDAGATAEGLIMVTEFRQLVDP